jgi:hypothetical protein
LGTAADGVSSLAFAGFISRAATPASCFIVALASACARAARACAKAVAGPTLDTAGKVGTAAVAGDLACDVEALGTGTVLAGSIAGAVLRRRRMTTVGWMRRISTSPRCARAERVLTVPREEEGAPEVAGRWGGLSVGRCTGFIVDGESFPVSDRRAPRSWTVSRQGRARAGGARARQRLWADFGRRRVEPHRLRGPNERTSAVAPSQRPRTITQTRPVQARPVQARPVRTRPFQTRPGPDESRQPLAEMARRISPWVARISRRF